VQLPVDPEVYRTLDRATPWLIGWLALFAAVTLVRLVRHRPGDAPRRETMVGSELPGLPLMLLHSVGFALSVWRRDVLSALLFLWWGPGYLVVSSIVLRQARTGARIDWRPYALATSWGCKLSYLVFMLIYASLALPGLPFVFSAWVVNDQVKLAWLRGNADRARRLTEDAWLPRLGYVLGLFVPLGFELPLRLLATGLGMTLFVLWVVGMARVLQAGRFFARPDPEASDNLRDIVYLSPRDR
jgi:hypothetical protein